MKGDDFLPLSGLSGAELQQRVFARWINVQLQDTNKKVGGRGSARIMQGCHGDGYDNIPELSWTASDPGDSMVT